MTDFMVRFLLCNGFLCAIITILFFMKRVFKNSLSARTQYHMWFLLFPMLAVPLLPFHTVRFSQITAWMEVLKNSILSNTEITPGLVSNTNLTATSHPDMAGTANWMNDFAVSVTSRTPPVAGWLLFGIWMTGVFIMLFSLANAARRLHALKTSSLPLQNTNVQRLYGRCLSETNVTKSIPIYSTAYLNTPMIAGILRPRIYLPIRLVSDDTSDHGSAMRHVLLHELQHYKHKDNLVNSLACIMRTLYWFHPLVRLALNEMQNDRELACDASVLELLDEDAYKDYGNALIHYASKISQAVSPLTTGLGHDMEQMKRRILHIATYKKPTRRQKTNGRIALALTAALFLGLAPILSTRAADDTHYEWEMLSNLPKAFSENTPANISHADFSAYFGEYEGSFVLYTLTNPEGSLAQSASDAGYPDGYTLTNPEGSLARSASDAGCPDGYTLTDSEGSLARSAPDVGCPDGHTLTDDTWTVYDLELATTRVAPNSTYKIYDSLFALEEGVITPEDSFLAWNKTDYPFAEWNADQTLPSAMDSSVNWYFQTLDERLGKSTLRSYLQKIGYGNENVNGDLASYWLESTLKISPVEQVELLVSLYRNDFGQISSRQNGLDPNDFDSNDFDPKNFDGRLHFVPKHVQAVKDAICLSASASGTLYGKTGTGRVDGRNANGWFVGFVETDDATYFFATYLHAEENGSNHINIPSWFTISENEENPAGTLQEAAGSDAARITLDILKDLGIWE
jgi:bla regulator protein BlaR1